MGKSVFSKIIDGEIPSYKIYEDDKVLAFLDALPNTQGHTLVIPKMQVDKFYDLPDEIYTHLFLITKKIAKNMDEVLQTRTLLKIIGTDVPHVHIHLIPFDKEFHAKTKYQPSQDDFEKTAQKLRMS